MSGTIDGKAGFFGRLRAAAGPDWDDYIGHPFVRQLGAATLPDACFRRFLVQDYLFLTHFARAYGLAVYKSTDLADIRGAAAGLDAVLTEIPLHGAYCASWGLDEAAMAAVPEAPATMTYTRYVIDVGMSGDILALTAALMPCVAGYAEIGQTLLQDPATVLDRGPYGAWLRTYGGEEYQAGVRTALDTFDGLARRHAGEARVEALSRIFKTATRLESAFWQMGLDAAPAAAPGGSA